MQEVVQPNEPVPVSNYNLQGFGQPVSANGADNSSRNMSGWNNDAHRSSMSSDSNIVNDSFQHQNLDSNSVLYPDGPLNPSQSFSQVNYQHTSCPIISDESSQNYDSTRFLPQYIIKKPSNCGIQVNNPGQYATLVEINRPFRSNNTEEVLPMQQSIANSDFSINAENFVSDSNLYMSTRPLHPTIYDTNALSFIQNNTNQNAPYSHPYSVFFQIGNSNPVEEPLNLRNKTKDNGEYYFVIFVNYSDYCCMILI